MIQASSPHESEAILKKELGLTNGARGPLFYAVFWLLLDYLDPNKTFSELALWLIKSHGAAAMTSLIFLGWERG